MNDRPDEEVTGDEFAEALSSDAPEASDDAVGSAGADRAGDPAASEAAGETGEAAEASVEQDLNALIEEARTQRDEYLDLAQRTKADFDNYRKRMAAETASARDRGRLEVTTGLIEAIDNLERVLAAEGVELDAALGGELSTESPVSLQGVIVAYRDLNSTLKRIGTEVYDPAGEAFDPTFHEALQAVPVDGVDPGVVVEVMQRGYRSGETVIRPARVVVSQ